MVLKKCSKISREKRGSVLHMALVFQQKIIYLFAVSTAILVTGCSAVGPDYSTPKADIPEAWLEEGGEGSKKEEAVPQNWWMLFNDPTLDRLIEEAAGSNLDLKIAMARMDEYQSRMGVVAGRRLPEINTDGSLLREKSSKNAGYSGAVNTTRGVGLQAGWEVDLFGRVRRSMEAAKADYEAVQEDRNDVMRSIYSRVAMAYINIRTAQARLAATNSNIDSQREVLKLTRVRFKYGLATSLEVAQAERALASTEATLPPIRTQLSESVNMISLLLGRNPGDLGDLILEAGNIPQPSEGGSVGIPADLLRQRPDIRRAERELAAQTARIGIAKAELYPQFSLIGSFGYRSSSGGDLSDSNYYSFGPSLRWNIFSGGSILNRIEVEDAITRQKAIAYEETVLSALTEVENAMTAYSEDRERLISIEEAVTASKKSVKLSLILYKQGLVDFENVVNSQQNQFVSENQLAQAMGDSAQNFVRLYTALGGGWNPDSAHKIRND